MRLTVALGDGMARRVRRKAAAKVTDRAQQRIVSTFDGEAQLIKEMVNKAIVKAIVSEGSGALAEAGPTLKSFCAQGDTVSLSLLVIHCIKAGLAEMVRATGVEGALLAYVRAHPSKNTTRARRPTLALTPVTTPVTPAPFVFGLKSPLPAEAPATPSAATSTPTDTSLANGQPFNFQPWKLNAGFTLATTPVAPAPFGITAEAPASSGAPPPTFRFQASSGDGEDEDETLRTAAVALCKLRQWDWNACRQWRAEGSVAAARQLQGVLDRVMAGRIRRALAWWKRRQALRRAVSRRRIWAAWCRYRRGPGGEAVAARSEEARLLQASLASLEGVYSAGVWDEEEARSLRQLVVPQNWREGQLAERVPEIASAGLAKRRSDRSAQADKRQAELSNTHWSSKECQLLGKKLRWGEGSGKPKAYAALQARLERTVGLEAVKAFVEAQLHEAAGRAALREPACRRHVVITGAFGTGKKTAAGIVGRLFNVLSPTATPLESGPASDARSFPFEKQRVCLKDPKVPVGDSKGGPLQTAKDVGVIVNCKKSHNVQVEFNGKTWWYAIAALRPERVASEDDWHASGVEVDSLKDLLTPGGEVDCKPDTVYFFRPAGETPSEEKDGRVLRHMQRPDVRSTLVLHGDPSSCAKYRQLEALKAVWPHQIALPLLSTDNLVRIAVEYIAGRGYRLKWAGEEEEAEEEERPAEEMMAHIVRQSFQEADIAARNVYCVRDMLELAVSRKSKRMAAQELGLDPRARMRAMARELRRLDVLLPGDFGVEMQTVANAEAQEEMRACFDRALAEAVAWGPADARADSPRAFLLQARKVLLSQEQSKAAQGPSREGRSALNWSLVVTGSSGSGKTKFLRLAAELLRAFGAVGQGAATRLDPGELAGLRGNDAGPKAVKDAFRKAAGGCLLVDGLHLLAGAGGLEADQSQKGREAFGWILAEMEESRRGPGAAVVLMAGLPEATNALLRTNPAADRLVPNQVAIADFSPGEVAAVVAARAGEELDPAVPARLERFLEERHGKALGGAGNAHLAESLLQAARHRALLRACEGGAEPGGAGGGRLQARDFGVEEHRGGSDEEKRAVDAEVESLIGMGAAKEWFAKLRKKVALVKKMDDPKALKMCYNVVITGNPGTGKTTFTRLLFKFLRVHGILAEDRFVEKNGLELKGEYLGQTAPKVQEAVAMAMGGCLFIDEAYALAGDGVGPDGDGFSKEAVRMLLTEVENHRTGLMVAMAGYKDKMNQFMRADPGLERRFPLRLHLEDYSPRELALICEDVALRRFGKAFESGLVEVLAKHIKDFHAADIAGSNGGLAVNLAEAAVDRLMVRVADLPEESSAEEAAAAFKELTAADFGIEEAKSLGDAAERAAVEREVAALVGMSAVKEYFQRIKRTIEYVEKGGNPQILRTSLNMVLTGNPGTGKTTVARLLARFLRAYGVLPKPCFVERNALELKGQFLGQTAPTVKEAVASALGGALFIDEAYALAGGGRGDKFGMEALRTLLTEVENNRDNLFVVLAGYQDKMEELVASDPGLARRFSQALHLEDYSPEDVSEICEGVAKERFGLTFPSCLRAQLAAHVRASHSPEAIARQNGGLAVNLTEAAFRHLANRVVLEGAEMSSLGASCLTAADFGIRPPALAPEAAPSGSPRTPGSPEVIRGPEVETLAGGVDRTAGAHHQLVTDSLRKMKLKDEWEEDEEGGAADGDGAGRATRTPISLLDPRTPSPGMASSPITGGAGGAGCLKKVLDRLSGDDERSGDGDDDSSDEERSERGSGEDSGESSEGEEEFRMEAREEQAVISAMGKCPCNYDWNELPNGWYEDDESCHECGQAYTRGFQCAGSGGTGGVHFLCRECVYTCANDRNN